MVFCDVLTSCFDEFSQLEGVASLDSLANILVLGDIEL
jgi:hypothetical protein